MANTQSIADEVRAFAAERRVFTRADMIKELGPKSSGSLANLLGADIVRQAVGVYSLRAVLTDDPRVLDLIAATGARPLSDADRASDAAKAEERAATLLAARTQRQESLPEQIATHFAEHPVASAAELKRLYGASAAGAAKALVDRGVLDKVRDGLWTRAGIDPFGPEMGAYVEQHSIELAAVRREIEEVADITAVLSEGRTAIEWNVSRGPGRPTKVYMNMTGVPSVWAQNRNGAIGWYAVKNLVSPTAAGHIARMVLNPMPSTIGELADMVAAGRAPDATRRRHGLWRDYQRPDQPEENEEVQAPRRGYGVYDTQILDPRRLGNGLPETVTLEIDDREDDRLVTILTGVPNLHIMTTRLDMADFVARHGDRAIAIERKTSSDLAASIDDNRLAEQVRRMSTSDIPCCFIIEGGMMGTRSQPLPKLASLQTRLNFGMNMRVIETIDLQHTAYAIVTTIRDAMFGTGTTFDLRPVKIPGIGMIERAQFMLQGIPGISPTRSAALLRRFGSIAGIARAGVKEIASIDGIGSKTAAALHDVLHAGEGLQG